MRNFLSSLALALLALAFGRSAQAQQPVLQRGYDADVAARTSPRATLNTSNVDRVHVRHGVQAAGGRRRLRPAAVRTERRHLRPGNSQRRVRRDDERFALRLRRRYRRAAVVGNFASSVGATPVPFAKFTFAGNTNITGNLGILSTPVIDPSTNILYLVACTLESSTMVYRLHAVDITSGTELIVAGGT